MFLPKITSLNGERAFLTQTSPGLNKQPCQLPAPPCPIDPARKQNCRVHFAVILGYDRRGHPRVRIQGTLDTGRGQTASCAPHLVALPAVPPQKL